MSSAATAKPPFTWVPIYKELGRKLLEYRDKQKELLRLWDDIRAKGVPFPGPDKHIDPFTFFAGFNRGTKDEHRITALAHLRQALKLVAEVPSDFAGIPIVDPRGSWFYSSLSPTIPEDVAAHWRLAGSVVSGPPESIPDDYFAKSRQVFKVGTAKITMGMFWLNPTDYIALDGKNETLFEKNGIDCTVKNKSDYVRLILEVKARLGSDFPEISNRAYELSKGPMPPPPQNPPTPTPGKKQVATHKPEPSVAVNEILYGPPGTGKTFSTIRRSVELAEPAVSGSDYKLHFDQLMKEGRIEFVTFHQSYSYEDFVEGLRPVLDSNSEGSARYECRAGVFRRLATRALFDSLAPTHQAHTFDQLWEALLTRAEEDPHAEYPGLTEKTKFGISVTSQGNLEGINVKSGTKFLCSRKVLEPVYHAKREQDTVSATEVDAVVRRGSHSHFVAAMFNELRRMEKAGAASKPAPIPVQDETRQSEIVQQFLTEGESSGYSLRPRQEWKNFVLIIDEINRGNISKILGELITLIEPDKRIGSGGMELISSLPYSEEKLGVPANLHVVGTMNSADKSIALVDLALRRRFQFREIPVNFQVCNGLTHQMTEVLEELNKRIVIRRDRDHQIGHAYFMNIKNEDDFDDRFRLQTIPLLQEYFYNDWLGLQFVLGDKDRKTFIRPFTGEKEAQGKWQWFFDEGDDIPILSSLIKNYALDVAE